MSSLILLTTVIILTTASVTYVTNLYQQQAMLSHLERIDKGLEGVLKEVVHMKEQLEQLRTNHYGEIRSIDEEGYPVYQSKYRPLPADFEMFAIGFVIIFFLVLFMMFKGDMSRGN